LFLGRIASNMVRRRELLGTAAAGAASLLAGCSMCGETWYGHRLTVDLASIAPTGDGYEVTVSATVAFEFPTEDRDGVGTFDLALYGADRSVLAAETVPGLRWGQVPEQERIDGRCGQSGTATATRTVTVPELPHYLGPRFHDGREAASLNTNSTAGFHELTVLRYRTADADGPSGDGTTTTGGPNGTATTDGPDGSATQDGPNGTATDETTTTEPTATGDVSPADYERVSVESLPWPTPDLQAVDATESLTNVRFRSVRGCYDRGELDVVFSPYRADLSLQWSRPVPRGECRWPSLDALSLADGRLVVDVGLAEVPYARCDPCDARRYELRVDYRADREAEIEEVLVRHLGTDGDVVERRVASAEEAASDDTAAGDGATTDE